MYEIPFLINDSTRSIEARQRPVQVMATQDEINHLVEKGYLQIDNLFDDATLEEFRRGLDRVIALETDNPMTEHLKDNGHYIRSLLDKDAIFHSLLYMKQPLSISRAVIGPQVCFDAEARVVPPNIPGLCVNWHIHHRLVPEPLPPFFCYPHAIHGLLYLDDVDHSTGPICLLPGSHLKPHLAIPSGNGEDREGQLILPVKAGTCLLMHANVWHRTIPTTKDAKQRRLILFGYNPPWIKPDIIRGVKPENRLTDELRKNGDAELRELLGEFHW